GEEDARWLLSRGRTFVHGRGCALDQVADHRVLERRNQIERGLVAQPVPFLERRIAPQRGHRLHARGDGRLPALTLNLTQRCGLDAAERKIQPVALEPDGTE